MKKFSFILAVLLLGLYCLCGCDIPEYSVSKVADEVIESEAVSEMEKVTANVTAEYPDDAFLAETDYYFLYDDPEGEFTKVLFKTDYAVKYFRFFVLETDEENWAQGKMNVGKVLYSLDEFSPNKPFVAEVQFGDTAALRGLSFVGPDGATHFYEIADSGMDGSLIFSETENIIDTVTFNAEIASEELIAERDSYHLYSDTDGDWTKVVFKTDKRITNIKFYKLDAADSFTDDGKLKITEVLYTLDELNADKPLVAEAELLDKFAVRGISFVDPNGNTHYFTVSESAENGKLVFTETEEFTEIK